MLRELNITVITSARVIERNDALSFAMGSGTPHGWEMLITDGENERIDKG